jgi:FkbM family methyltransferase
MKNYLEMVRRQPRPMKFLLAQVLKRTGLCRFFSISQDGYTLTFFPSNLSTSLWIDPHDRDEDQLFLRRYLKPGDTVIDVGANIGFTVLASSRAVGASGRVFGFEPHPRIFKYLSQNVARNNATNVQLYNVAVGDTEGEIGFSDTKRDDMNRPDPANQSMKIPLRTLDQYMAQQQRIDLLKIDVEGYEKLVFTGATQVLGRARCVYFEASEENFRNFQYATPDLLKILFGAGFEVYRLQDQKLIRLAGDYIPPALENLLAIRSLEDFHSRTGLGVS